MQIVNNIEKPIDYSYKNMLGYFQSMRLINFEKVENEQEDLWVANLLYNNQLEKRKLKFIKNLDSFLPLKTIDIVIEDTSVGDVFLVDFKPVITHSILEIIPDDLISYVQKI